MQLREDVQKLKAANTVLITSLNNHKTILNEIDKVYLHCNTVWNDE
jgi:hypothetical protein